MKLSCNCLLVIPMRWHNPLGERFIAAWLNTAHLDGHNLREQHIFAKAPPDPAPSPIRVDIKWKPFNFSPLHYKKIVTMSPQGSDLAPLAPTPG